MRRERTGYVCGAVGRSIVDDQQFNLVTGLAQDAFDCLSEESLTIKDRYDATNKCPHIYRLDF